MSTKAMHEALDRFRDLLMDVGAPPDGDDMECLLRARDEMTSIERAAKMLSVAECVYFSDDPKMEKVRALDALFSISKEAP